MKSRLIREFPINVNPLMPGVVYIPSTILRNIGNGIYTRPVANGLK